MQAREIRTWSTEELHRRLNEAYQELFVLRRNKAAGRLSDYSRLRAVKRDIARLHTILRERELAALQEGGNSEAAS